jgi:hypothetical protein
MIEMHSVYKYKQNTENLKKKHISKNISYAKQCSNGTNDVNHGLVLTVESFTVAALFLLEQVILLERRYIFGTTITLKYVESISQ